MGWLLVGALVLLLLSGDGEAQAGQRQGPLPGVPPDLQGPPVDLAVALAAANADMGQPVPQAPPVPPGTPDLDQWGPDRDAAPLQVQVSPDGTRLETTEPPEGMPAPRNPRVSVQPTELPSSPELRNLPIPVRAEGRRLATIAAQAVRRRQGRVVLAEVQAFQTFIGIRADGKWGAETARWAGIYTGAAVPPSQWGR